MAPPFFRLALNAMATRFEVVLHGDPESSLRAAAEEAFREIERLDAQLSFFRPTSEIHRINHHATNGPIRIEPGVFRLLVRAKELSRLSGGAFDITVGPLLRCWGFIAKEGRKPSDSEVAEALAQVGMDHVVLDETRFTVSLDNPGATVDLGAIGKGYALDCAAELLLEAGVRGALLHGGTSTVIAIGRAPDGEAWNVAIERPPDLSVTAPSPSVESLPAIAIVPLENEALSVSGLHGKYFAEGGKIFGHIIDPRTGRPADKALLAAVVLPSATESDALSTALLTLGPEGFDQILEIRPGMKALVLSRATGSTTDQIRSAGIPVVSS
jgi:thiamine biosynthesis lipoprotein